MTSPMPNVFVGAETGLLKGINVQKAQCLNLNSLTEADKEKEIVVMCWGNDEENEVCFGLKNRQVQIYDSQEKSFLPDVQTFEGGTGKFCGIAKYEGKFITAVQSGLVKIWGEDEDGCTTIEAGKDLHCMVQNQENPKKIATGGKENDLKIWDLNKHTEPIFKAKNVKNDWLNLRVPVWVTGVQFIPGSEQVVTATGHHQIRVYDPATSQRRPVIDVTFDEYPLTAISLRHDVDKQVLVGNTQGNMALVDLRNGKVIQLYKGFAGGIRDIKCHATKPLVASCGLDRHLRIHDINSKELVHKLYLKSRLNCLLFSSKEERKDSDEIETTVKASNVNAGSESGIESASDVEDVWDNFEKVETRVVKKHIANDHDEDDDDDEDDDEETPQKKKKKLSKKKNPKSKTKKAKS